MPVQLAVAISSGNIIYDDDAYVENFDIQTLKDAEGVLMQVEMNLVRKLRHQPDVHALVCQSPDMQSREKAG
jgi:hypothetical protein